MEQNFKQNQQKENGDGLKVNAGKRNFEKDFPVMKTSITTTEKFGKLVSGVFKGMFNDYSGCFIAPSHGGVAFSIYFVKSVNTTEDPEKITALRFLAEPSRYRSLLETYTARFSRKQYEILPDCRQAILPFLEDRLTIKTVEKDKDGKVVFKEDGTPSILYSIDPNVWSKLVTEISDNNRFRNSTIYGDSDITNVKVSGLDIYNFLKIIYGKKDDGIDIEYRVRFEAPLSPTVNGSPNRIMVIDRIKKSDIAKILDYNGRTIRTAGGINKY